MQDKILAAYIMVENVHKNQSIVGDIGIHDIAWAYWQLYGRDVLPDTLYVEIRKFLTQHD